MCQCNNISDALPYLTTPIQLNMDSSEYDPTSLSTDDDDCVLSQPVRQTHRGQVVSERGQPPPNFQPRQPPPAYSQVTNSDTSERFLTSPVTQQCPQPPPPSYTQSLARSATQGDICTSLTSF